MKPTSIIFLIVSVALALAGLVTMRIAEGIGVREGIQVVADTTDEGDSVFTYDFSEDSIGKISVSVGTADINIIGGADKPYIELVNFADGLYEFSGAVSETRENIRITARDATGDGAPASLSACIVTRSALTSHSRVSPSARDVRYSASFLAAEVSL